jgi:hypothetical protein
MCTVQIESDFITNCTRVCPLRAQQLGTCAMEAAAISCCDHTFDLAGVKNMVASIKIVNAAAVTW